MPSESQEPRSRTPWLSKPARLALLLYFLLLTSAVLSGLRPIFEQWVREGRWPRGILMAGPVLFSLFIALFALYRFSRVRAGRYNAGKAFVQVGVMVLVLALLLPGSLGGYRSADGVRPIDLAGQLHSADPEARAVAAELVRHRSRSDRQRYLPRLVDLLEDPSIEVRRQARVSLVSIAGQDAGGNGSDAPERWRAFWRSQGVAIPETQ